MLSNVTILLLVVLCCLKISSSIGESVIHVCGYNTLLSAPLRNLSFLSDHRNITISLCSGNSVLDGDLKFTDKDVVQIIGEEDSVLSCRGQSAGITYSNVHYIKFLSITLENCGSVHKLDGADFSSSILITNTSELSMQSSSILNSRGLGMVLLQSYAVIDIVDCTFKNGTASSSLCGGGGLFVQVDCAHCTGSYMRMNISNTKFQNNNASFYKKTTCDKFSFQNGGGLTLNLYGSENNNHILIRDCIIESNTALHWGGGLNVVIANISSNNTITITNTTLSKNKCMHKGGGGADIGFYIDTETRFPENNKILFIDTTFEDNTAKFGGGVLVYSPVAELHEFESNTVTFLNCDWIGNTARYSSAVYLNLHNEGTYNSAGLLPKVMFENCFLGGNQAHNYDYSYYDPFSTHVHKRGKGCFFSIGYKVTFTSSMQFVNNSGSALYLASSVVKVESGSIVSFIGNTGHYGGAISLFGTSILHLHDNVALEFTNNTAAIKGGAIYQEHTDTLEYISLTKCFFHYHYNHKENTITCLFKNNRVENGGSSLPSSLNGASIYMHSLKSCESLIDFSNNGSTVNGTTGFRGSVAHFVFENSIGDEISTAGRKFRVTMNITGKFPIIPGKVTQLPVEVNDDFNRSVVSVYQAQLLKNDDELVSLHSDYTNVYDNTILLCGAPGAVGNISFSLSSIGDEEIILPIELIECPPGYVLKGEASCTCSTAAHGISTAIKTNFEQSCKEDTGWAMKTQVIITRGSILYFHSPVLEVFVIKMNLISYT